MQSNLHQKEKSQSVCLIDEDSENVTIEFDRYWHWNSKEKLATIFDNFQQASSTSRIYGGTGLGLAIVKQLVEPQGGVINGQ
jgi:signal transduction histidine kinase